MPSNKGNGSWWTCLPSHGSEDNIPLRFYLLGVPCPSDGLKINSGFIAVRLGPPVWETRRGEGGLCLLSSVLVPARKQCFFALAQQCCEHGTQRCEGLPSLPGAGSSHLDSKSSAGFKIH